MNKLRAVYKKYKMHISITLFIIGLIGHIFVALYGTLNHPYYNTYAAYWRGFMDYPIIGAVSLISLITGYVILQD